MLSHRTSRPLPAWFCAAALAGCGGGGSAVGPLPQPITLPPATPGPPVLVAGTGSLALAVAGQPRDFVITNLGGQEALNLVASASRALPAGSVFSTDCHRLAPGASCTLNVTPGATPSAAPGDTAPLPAEVELAGSNTNRLALSVWVLDFGSVYQGGYVFDLDDSTPVTFGVGGKVLALNDALPPVNWAPHDAATFLNLSTTDGAANTAAIVQQYGPPPNASPFAQYPAWACSQSVDAGFSDWYLPALCELGYDGTGRGSGCGTIGAPTLANVQSRLVDPGHTTGMPPFSQYWSSSTAPGVVWTHHFVPGAGEHHQDPVQGANGGRCVRALTP